MRTLILSACATLISFNAHAWTYETTYWFKKIKAECSEASCDIYVNAEFMGNHEYTLHGSIAKIAYQKYDISVDLHSGDFEYKKVR